MDLKIRICDKDSISFLKVLIFSFVFLHSSEPLILKLSGSEELITRLKLQLSNRDICVTQSRRPLIFQTMNYARWNSKSFNFQRVTPSAFKDIGIRHLDFNWKESAFFRGRFQFPKYEEVIRNYNHK